MSSGKSHDRAIVITLAPTTVAAFYYLPIYFHAPTTPFIAISAYIMGGYWFSPDIDLRQSLPSKRLGILSILWKPYRKLSGHRGFSHAPIIGTLSRMFYIAIPAIAWGMITKYSFHQLWNHREVLAALFIGLETSAWVHLIMDYTPGLNKN
jgi:uncharacterized metal-binding protein